MPNSEFRQRKHAQTSEVSHLHPQHQHVFYWLVFLVSHNLSDTFETPKLEQTRTNNAYCFGCFTVEFDVFGGQVFIFDKIKMEQSETMTNRIQAEGSMDVGASEAAGLLSSGGALHVGPSMPIHASSHLPTLTMTEARSPVIL